MLICFLVDKHVNKGTGSMRANETLQRLIGEESGQYNELEDIEVDQKDLKNDGNTLTDVVEVSQEDNDNEDNDNDPIESETDKEDVQESETEMQNTKSSTKQNEEPIEEAGSNAEKVDDAENLEENISTTNENE